jgi:hypothetical protein
LLKKRHESKPRIADQQFKVSTHGAFIAEKRGACRREEQLAKARHFCDLTIVAKAMGREIAHCSSR